MKSTSVTQLTVGLVKERRELDHRIKAPVTWLHDTSTGVQWIYVIRRCEPLKEWEKSQMFVIGINH